MKSLMTWAPLLSLLLLTFNHQSWMFAYQSWLESLVTGLNDFLKTIGLV